MKSFSPIIIALFICSPAFSQITVRTAPEPEPPKVSPYDSTKNFLGNRGVSSYIGQLLYVNGKAGILQKHGYDYFYSKKYRGDGCRYGQEYGKAAFNSPYESLVGKYFIVKSVEEVGASLNNYWFELENRDKPDDIAWFFYQGEYEHAFPFIVVSHFEYLKERYIGKEIVYFKDNPRDEIRIETNKCTDVGIEDRHFNLSLFFDDGKVVSIEYDKESSPLLGRFILKDAYDRLVTKYGIDMVHKAFNNKICVGMPEELLILSWGKPSDINRNSYNESDQWVYDSQYVYLKNGIVTAWSD